MTGAEILTQAGQVAEDYLALVETLATTKQFQADNSSRLVCRCPSCKASRARAILWAQAMREAPAPAPGRTEATAGTVVDHSSEGIALD